MPTRCKQISTNKCCPLIIFFLFLLILTAVPDAAMAAAAEVTLAWDENTEHELVGYRVFCRQKGENYNHNNPIWDGTETTCTIFDLEYNTTYYFVVRAYDFNEKMSGDSNEVTAVLTEDNPGTPLTPPYQQDTGAAGIVSIEGEHFDANLSRGGHDWMDVFPSGHSGPDGAMEASPNTGTNNNTGYESRSPRLDFEVNFVHTGIHYVWVRGIGASGSDDSVHVGLDGRGLSSSDRISSFGKGWTWSNDTMDKVVATVDVGTAGVHTVNVWMREDGFVLDKVVLTTRSSYIPTGVGPVESPRGNSRAFNPDVQPDAADGIVSIEGERFDDNVSQGGHDWEEVYDTSYSDDYAMQAVPPGGNDRINTSYVGNSPRLDFDVCFEKIGTHYVWIRGVGLSGNDDSCHVGLNRQAVNTSDRISGFSSSGDWSNSTMDGVRATINIPSIGLHTINVWMREDGFIIDKLVFTTDPNYVPSGMGPADSPTGCF